MATTFAVTGIHRSRLKHYRPSYQSDLPPIYEDAVQRQHFPASYSMPDNDDYIYLPSYMPSGRYYKQHEKRVHDYEEINAETLSRVNALPSTSLIKTSKTSMLDGIMSNRFQLKSTSLDKDTESDCDNKAVLQTDENTKNGAHKCPLRRKSTVYQGHALTNGENTSTIKTNAETTAELDANKDSSWQWPKFKPDTFINPHFWCPAEKKIQKRCFAVCFILLLIIIAIFVIVSLDGWVYKASGTGLSGREKPILFAAAPPVFPQENMTDIRHRSSNLTSV